jgi:hypothetical protein
MTRLLSLVVVALMALAACSAPEAPEAAATPPAATPAPVPQLVPVHILLPESPDEGVSAWAQALTDAIAAGHGGLTLVGTPEEALVGVRIDAVEEGTEADPVPEGEGEFHVMRGALLVGADTHEFNLAYRDDVAPEAEALARNLRKLAVQAASAGSAEAAAEAEGSSEEGGAASEAEGSSEEDTAASEPDAEDEG